MLFAYLCTAYAAAFKTAFFDKSCRKISDRAFERTACAWFIQWAFVFAALQVVLCLKSERKIIRLIPLFITLGQGPVKRKRRQLREDTLRPDAVDTEGAVSLELFVGQIYLARHVKGVLIKTRKGIDHTGLEFFFTFMRDKRHAVPLRFPDR